MTEQDARTAFAMQAYGGSFVKYIGMAARNADPQNLQKIKDTWPEYWAKYSEMAKGMQNQQ